MLKVDLKREEGLPKRSRYIKKPSEICLRFGLSSRWSLSAGTVITNETKEPNHRALQRALLFGCIVSFVVRNLCLGTYRRNRYMCKVATMQAFYRGLNQILFINRKCWPHHYFKISSNDVTGSFCGHSKGGRGTS